VAKRAGLDGVRLHDLRHTYASFGAGGGLGLPIIGKLLGHTQASTTQRYAHLDADPLRRASEAIGGRIAAALDGRRSLPGVFGAPPLVSQLAILATCSMPCSLGFPSSFVSPNSFAC
jgi:hypothetical protein